MYPMSSRNMSYFIVAPNGVDGAFFRGITPTVPFNKTNLTTDSEDEEITSSEDQNRPKELEVKTMNGFSGKFQDSSSSEDGSLPCTPVMHPETVTDVNHAGEESVENDTRQLINSFLKDFTGLSKPRWSDSKALSTMKRVVEGVLSKHRYAFNGMINKLSLKTNQDDMAFIGEVANSLFSDGITNWGRIVSFVAFGASVCQHLKENGRQHCVDLVSQEICSYLLTHQKDWLLEHRSWDGFVEFFRVTDNDSSMKSTLKAFAAFAGIGATLALLIR